MNHGKLFSLAAMQGISYALGQQGLVRKKPWNIVIRPTNRCNLRCRHCDLWKLGSSGELPLNSWKTFVSDMKSWLGQYYLSISGGEPLARKDDTLEIVRHASSEGVFTSLHTNGWALDSAAINRLEAAGLDRITFSLDGMAPGTHDSTRGRKGAHKRVLESVSLMNMKGTGMILGVNSIIMKSNIEEIPSMIEWARDSGIRISFQGLGRNFGGVEDPSSWFKESLLWPSPVQASEAISTIMEMKRKGYPVVNPLSHLSALMKYYANPLSDICGISCNADKSMHIRYNGDILMCLERWGPIGNITRDHPRKAWESSRAMLIRRRIKSCRRQCMILNCNYDKGVMNVLRGALSLARS